MKKETYLYCSVPLAPLRQAASDRSELETQALYGEKFKLMGTATGDWVHIRSLEDNYPGWADKKLFSLLPPSDTLYTLIEPAALIRIGQTSKWLSFGAMLPEQVVTDNPESGFVRSHICNDLSIADLAKLFLGAPYLWGGKSVFGIDCSGYTQLLHFAMGISIPRNAAQQEMIGTPIPYDKRQTGDLAFFANPSGEVIHVGIILHESIIHAHGEVRIDLLTPEGIFNDDFKKITHRLHTIRRLIA